MPSVLSSVMGGRSGTSNAMLEIEGLSGEASVLVCQFNPDKLDISARGVFTSVERPGEDSPIVQFMGGGESVMNLHLYFDTSTSYELKGSLLAIPKKQKASDVSEYANKLMSLVKIEGKEHRPPVVTFIWGSTSFAGFVRHVSIRYTMFEAGGMPVRCEAKLLIVQMDLNPQGSSKMSPLESPDRTKSIVLKEGMTLWGIARDEYGDAGLWREIARANRIMDPLSVPVGTRLKVPALTD